MAYVRGQERLVYEEVFRRLKDGMLTTLGWDGNQLEQGGLPYGASYPITWIEQPPDVKIGAVASNTIAFTEGDAPDEQELELGGQLVSVDHTFFVDIYGEDLSMSRAIAGDVRSIFTGNADGCRRCVPMRDWTQNGLPILPGHLLYFQDVLVSRPPSSAIGRNSWTVVKFTAVHTWS